MSISQRFDCFLDNLSLSQEQRNDAKSKYDGVCSKLHNYFYNNNYSGQTRLLVGSYGKRTNIRPPRDVDVFFIMPVDEFRRYNSYSGNGQSKLLQDVKNILKDRYSTTDGIKGDGQVVVVPFQGGHNIELLPAWLLDNGKYYIPNTSNGGNWKTVDPKAEINQIDDSDRNTNNNARRLIKMLKAWQGYCNVPIKSLVLELRAIYFLKKWEYAKNSSTYYDWMIRDFFQQLLNYVNGNCKLPGLEEQIKYGNAWRSKAETALKHAINACEYEDKKDEYRATLEWKSIFGNDFVF